MSPFSLGDLVFACVISVIVTVFPASWAAENSGLQTGYRAACDQHCGVPGIVDFKGPLPEWRCVCPAPKAERSTP
ncbi:MAG: hypothetical protein KJ648_07540 [Candidatus Omnitrophica bacterium]|nr:hypothetical protein [Candidatus Omnitrophota bacterium]